MPAAIIRLEVMPLIGLIKRAQVEKIVELRQALLASLLLQPIQEAQRMLVEALKLIWRHEIIARGASEAEVRLRRYEEFLKEASRCWAEDAEEFLSRWREQRMRRL